MRHCPSTIHFGGGTLVIRGDNQADNVLVTGDGAGGASVTLNGGTAQTFARVRHVAVHVGRGNDSITLDFASGLIGPRLKVDLEAGDGNDVVTTNFGSVANTDVFADLHLGKGNDTWNTTLNGAITGSSRVRFQAEDDKGDESITFNATGADIASTARLSLDWNGGRGKQTTTVNFAGKVEGKLDVDVRAHRGVDVLAANLNLASGSTGKVRARLDGGNDNDNVTLNVNLATPTDTVAVHASLDGGKGFDTCVATTNVVVKNCEA